MPTLITLPILTALALAAIYPCCFWIPVNDAFREKFRKFNIALPNTIGGLVLVSVWLINIPISLKIIVTVWKIVLFSVSRYSWKKKYPNPILMTLPCLFGIYAFIRLQSYFAAPEEAVTLIGILGR